MLALKGQPLHLLFRCHAEACCVLGKMYHVGWHYKAVILALFGLAKVEHAKVCLQGIGQLGEVHK